MKEKLKSIVCIKCGLGLHGETICPSCGFDLKSEPFILVGLDSTQQVEILIQYSKEYGGNSSESEPDVTFAVDFSMVKLFKKINGVPFTYQQALLEKKRFRLREPVVSDGVFYVDRDGRPQREITSETEMEALNKLAELEKLNETSTKYRKTYQNAVKIATKAAREAVIEMLSNDNVMQKRQELKESWQKAGYKTVTFGQYAGEPVTWLVLTQEEGKALLMTEEAVDCRAYNDSVKYPYSWDVCSLREWLNGEFFRQAFNTTEQNMIVETTLQNPKHTPHTVGDKTTKDKVFCLSAAEAEKYFDLGSNRCALPRVAAVINGAGINYGGNCCCSWWLRSYFYENESHWNYPDCVDERGWVNKHKRENNSVAVRPAVWVDAHIL